MVAQRPSPVVNREPVIRMAKELIETNNKFTHSPTQENLFKQTRKLYFLVRSRAEKEAAQNLIVRPSLHPHKSLFSTSC